MIRTQAVALPAALGSERGLLVFNDEVLLAVLACLDGEFYGADCGKWHVEASFSPALDIGAVVPNLEAELQELEGRLNGLTDY